MRLYIVVIIANTKLKPCYVKSDTYTVSSKNGLFSLNAQHFTRNRTYSTLSSCLFDVSTCDTH